MDLTVGTARKNMALLAGIDCTYRGTYDVCKTTNGGCMESKELQSVVELAIKKEEEAYDFYMDLYSLVKAEDVKETMKFLAAEEQKHKKFLVEYRDNAFGGEGLRMTSVVDYKVAEHLEKPDPSKTFESKDAYLLAAHRELNAYNFYRALADIHPDGTVRDTLLRMANEELKHKEKVEYLYSNAAFPQTAGG